MVNSLVYVFHLSSCEWILKETRQGIIFPVHVQRINNCSTQNLIVYDNSEISKTANWPLAQVFFFRLSLFYFLHDSPFLSLQVRDHSTTTLFFNPCLTVCHAFASPASCPHPYDMRSISSAIIAYDHTLKPVNFPTDSVLFVALKPIVRVPLP